jgi:hypothetical protein
VSKTTTIIGARRRLDFVAESHTDLLRFDDFELDLPEDEDARLDVSFLHRSHCIAGLPVREPKSPMSVFSKFDGRFSLTVHPTTITLPEGDLCEIGVPWGAKARLLILWIASKINEPERASGDPWVEIGNIDEWLREVGIVKNGKSVPATKDQLIRLAFSSFTMILKGGPDAGSYFQNNRLFQSGAFHDDDLENYRKGNLGGVRWPTALKLSNEAQQQLTSNAIPIPTGRLAEVSNNPTAIDLLVYLCYRLPLIGPNSSELVTWKMLNTQFGSHTTISRFKEQFLPALKAVRAAYPEANIDVTAEGLVLFYSDPAVLRRAFVALTRTLDPPKRRRKPRNRFDSATDHTGG